MTLALAWYVIPTLDAVLGIEGTNHNFPFKIEDEFITSVRTKDITRSKVDISIQGNTGIIKDSESKAYRGLLSTKLAKALHEFQERFQVMLSAEAKAPNTLFIVIYGLRSESEAVGDILMEHRLYLQLPESFDSSVPYRNPQTFSLPGLHATLAQEIPMRDQVGLSITKTPVLDTVAKSRVAELLDSATGPKEFQEIQASHKLITKLKS
jgi:hypothetical protein